MISVLRIFLILSWIIMCSSLLEVYICMYRKYKHGVYVKIVFFKDTCCLQNQKTNWLEFLFVLDAEI